MPAFGPGDPPPVVVRRRRRVQRQQPPSSEALKGRAFGSRPARPLPKPKAARVVRAVPIGTGDTKGDVAAGEGFKRTRPYRGAVVAAYTSRPVRERKALARRAQARIDAGIGTAEDEAVAHIHRTRVAGTRKISRAEQAFEALDPVSTAVRHGVDIAAETHAGRVQRVIAPEHDISRPRGRAGVRVVPSAKGEDLGDVARALAAAVTGIGEASSKGYASINAPKLIQNIPKDIAEIAVTTPTSIAKLGSDVVHHPERVPGELVAPYKQLVEDPGRFVTEHPVSAALMVAPVVRVPGRAAGRVARLAGKQTLERPAAVLPGTNLVARRTGSKDIVVRAVQSRRDKRAGQRVMSDKEVGRRVDEFFDANRGERDRIVAGATRDAEAQGLTGEALDKKLRGARKGAKKYVRRKFAAEFGGDVHPTKEAAQAAAESLPFEGRVMRVGKGQHTVVPEIAADRLRGHEAIGKSKATGAKVLRQTRRAFTRTVLPFSATWLSGQAIESAFRAMVAGAGPVSYVRGARVVRRLDPEAQARLLPGGKSRIPAEILGEGPKTLEAEFAGTALARVAKAMTTAGRAPGVRQVRDLHRATTDFVFDTLNGRIIEGTAQKAMLGRALKESPLMERRVVGLSDKAIAEAADGLKATDSQVALGRELHKMYGKYQAFSPDAREGILHWTPFAPWLGNMARFLFRTLPADHPVATALLADIDAAEEDWRKAAGFSLRGGDRRPGYLMGGYPAGPGGEQTTRVGRFLPFAPGDIGTKTLVDLVLPQFSGAAAAWSGRDPVTDEPLHGKFGPEASEQEKALAGAIALIESMVPGIGVAHRVAERGPRQVFDPFAPTRKPKPRVRRRGVRVAPRPVGLLGEGAGLSGNPLLGGGGLR